MRKPRAFGKRGGRLAAQAGLAYSASMDNGTRDRILVCAREMAQSHGISGISFREVAARIGIKSASVHYHFPTKDDLILALVRAQHEETAAALDAIARTGDFHSRMRAFAGLFRQHLEHGNRFCLCGMMGAEVEALPDAARIELAEFFEMCARWVTAQVTAFGPAAGVNPRALGHMVVAGIEGAMLLSRVRGHAAAFDEAVNALLYLLSAD